MADNQSQKSTSKKGGSQTTVTSVVITILIAVAIWYFRGGSADQPPTGAQPEAPTAQAVADVQAEPAATQVGADAGDSNADDSATSDSATDDSTTESEAGTDESSESSENPEDSEAAEIEVVEVETNNQDDESEPEAAATEAPEPELTATETPEPESTATETPEPEPTASNTPEPEPTVAPASTSPPKPTVAPTAAPRAGPYGMRTITMAELPPEAVDTINLIWDNESFPFDKDDTTFGNREGRLPKEGYDYYREFTVITPGLSHRGAKRIIEGEEGELYYTEDHYDSFYWVVTE